MNDEVVFTLPQAADFLKMGKRKTRDWIKSGRLYAEKTSEKNNGHYRILKSACIDAVKNKSNNSTANADSHTERGKTEWQSGKEAPHGIVTSKHQTDKELGKVLALRTKSKLRSCTTN